MTRHLNQDPLENTFGKIRSAGGNNINPSVFEAKHIIAKIISLNILSNVSKYTNCEITEDDNNTSKEFQRNESIVGVLNSPITEIIDDDSDDEFENVDFVDCLENSNEFDFEIECFDFENLAETISARYFSGFVLHRLLPKINCTTCEKNFQKQNEEINAPSECLIKNKNFYCNSDLKLKAPTDLFFNYLSKCINIFKVVWEKKCFEKNIKEHVIENCKKMLHKEQNIIFNESNECFQHVLKILDYTVLVLIRKHASWTCAKIIKNKKNSRKPRDKRWVKYN